MKYIKSSSIVEYDMKSAGMNILYELGYINEEKFKQLKSMNKYKRNVEIGLMLRKNRDMNEALIKGFEYARQMFIVNNNIQDHEILSIKKDAIYVINKLVTNLDVTDNIKFVKKKEYDTYINIMNREHYINLQQNDIDVKGYREGVFEHHINYMIKFLYDIIKMDSQMDKESIVEELTIFKHRYITFDLPRGYYKDIINNKYIIDMEFDTLTIDNIGESNKEILNYNVNLKFILEVINALL